MNTPNLSLLLIMICFWVAFWVVNRFLIKPVSAVVTERQSRLDKAQQEWSTRNQQYLAATAKLEAENEAAARAAAKHRAELRQSALTARGQRLESTRGAANERLEKALHGLDEEAKKARTELERRARELAVTLASHLLEREVAG